MLVALSGTEESMEDLKGFGFDEMIEKPLDQKKMRYLLSKLEHFNRVRKEKTSTKLDF